MLEAAPTPAHARRALQLRAISREQFDAIMAGEPFDLHDPAAGLTLARAAAVILLGGFAGLRPTEILRVLPADLDVPTSILHVGQRQAKNNPSVRSIPLAPEVARRLEPLLSPALFLNRNRQRPMNEASLRHYMSTRLAATGLLLPPKYLRKSFVSALKHAGARPDLLERYIGHAISDQSAVTAQSYLADYDAIQLQPIANLTDGLLRNCYKNSQSIEI